MAKAIIAVLAVAIVVFVGGYFLMSWSYQNQETELRNLANQKQEVCAAHFDKMWKTIQQVAQVPDAAKQAFREMYEPLISGRYSADSGGVFMKWIQEQNPAFDWTLYGRVQTTVIAERESFFKDQEALLDVKREHTNLIQKRPGRWFLDPSDTLKVTIITSEKTKEAYETGEENDVDLFKQQ